ncbi:hypothetical protein MKX01_005130 [Papaver californicum]|nr:hypothetical protein MKX01_005130 [Papaver californicum]
MRIRKLIAQKKISETHSDILPSSSTATPTKTITPCSSAAAAVSTSCEEERVNNLQKKEEVVVCEQNMSLWDVIPVKELLYYWRPDKDFKVLKKEEYDDEIITDESLNAEDDQISVEENDRIESEDDDDEETEEEELEMKRCPLTDKGKLGLKSATKIKKRKRDNDDDTDDYEEEKKKKRLVYCCKTDGKGWHCRSKAQMGNPLCKHHMIQMQHYSDHQRDNNYHQQKIQKLEKKTTRRGRPPNESRTNTVDTTIRGRRNKGKLSGKKSSEFYYYSGFGPLWGKNKRGRPPNEVKKEQEEEEEEEELEERQVIDDQTSPKMKIIVKEENVNDNGCMFVDDDFDDDDSDEDCNGVNGKKRYRKPIKARSLASLLF